MLSHRRPSAPRPPHLLPLPITRTIPLRQQRKRLLRCSSFALSSSHRVADPREGKDSTSERTSHLRRHLSASQYAWRTNKIPSATRKTVVEPLFRHRGISDEEDKRANTERGADKAISEEGAQIVMDITLCTSNGSDTFRSFVAWKENLLRHLQLELACPVAGGRSRASVPRQSK